MLAGPGRRDRRKRSPVSRRVLLVRNKSWKELSRVSEGSQAAHQRQDHISLVVSVARTVLCCTVAMPPPVRAGWRDSWPASSGRQAEMTGRLHSQTQGRSFVRFMQSVIFSRPCCSHKHKQASPFGPPPCSVPCRPPLPCPKPCRRPRDLPPTAENLGTERALSVSSPPGSD